VLVDVAVTNLVALEQALGAPATDALLAAASARLGDIVRADDVIVRVGRDAFSVICTDLSAGAVDALVARLRHELAGPFPWDGVPITLDVEVAIASHQDGVRRSSPGEVAPPPGWETLDATEPPRAEVDRLRRMLDASDEVVLVLDADWRITYASASIEREFGLPPEQALGRSFWSWTVPGSSSPAHDEIVERLREPGARVRMELQLAGADGARRRVQATAHHDPATSDGPVVVLRDVTETVDALAALRVEQQRTAAIVEHSTVAILFFEPDGTIAWASPATARLFQVEVSHMIGRNGFEMIHPGDRERAVTELLSVSPGGHVRTEFRVIDGGGRTRWVEECVTDLVDNPAVGYVVANLRDITDRREAEESMRFQSELLRAVGRSVIATDLHGIVQFWNTTAEELYGWTADEALGRNVVELTGPIDAEGHVAVVAERLSKGASWSGDVWLRRRDGSRFLASITNTPLFGEHGELIGVIGVSVDLTDRLELARAAEEDRRRLADAQRNAHLGSFEIDVHTGDMTWSDELYRILGIDLDVTPSRELFRSLIHPDDRDAATDAANRALARRETEAEWIYRIVRPNGERRWVITRTSSVSSDGTRIGGTAQDVTERYEAEQRTVHQALHDPLTDLPNRVHLTNHLETLLAQQRRGGPPATVAFLDLDRFKVINDGLGHAVGDRVLLEAARRLSASVDPGWFVGRFGGDEFVVVGDRAEHAEDAIAYAERLAQCLEPPIEIDGRSFFLTASVGVALSRVGDDPDAVLQAADTAMYEAKRLVGVRSRYFDDRLHRQRRERLDLENDLRRALVHDELTLHYQPLMRLTDDTCIGFESLLRWNHPRLGLVSPADFVPIAEETGLIVPIGEWVLEQSLAQLAMWRQEPGWEALRVSVNLSANQLTSDELTERVAEAVRRSGVPAAALHLEITESVLMDGIEGSLKVLNRLRRLGLHLAVDDFGTGYSSLSYLKQLPVDVLKIDRSFVDGLGSDPHDTSIVQAITAMADALALEILAEGVETERQLSALRELGCPLAQGYLWSEPLTPADATEWLRARRAAPG
jgi:diguanylate cyclase (GGDEF)-like protein/PAS domain S-box-containing protein